MRKQLLVGLALSGIVVFGVWASIPDSNGAIHGCYANSNGNLRLIDSSTTMCKHGETEITWNQAGLQGPQGPIGPEGAQGPMGLQGPAGPLQVAVVQDEFDSRFLKSDMWDVYGTGTGQYSLDDGYLLLQASNGGSRLLRTTHRIDSSPFMFAVSDGPLRLTTRLRVDSGSWGFASGLDRSNAIEFAWIPDASIGQQLAARTVANGLATETVIPVAGVAQLPSYGPPVFYTIVAESERVRFFINGAFVTEHTTSIPQTPLNVLVGVTSNTSSLPTSNASIDFISLSKAE